jgi:hypothetical protein
LTDRDEVGDCSGQHSDADLRLGPRRRLGK